MHADDETKRPRYDEKQIRLIMKSAISRSDLEASLWSHDDLVQIAAELGIPERILVRQCVNSKAPGVFLACKFRGRAWWQRA